MATSEFVQTGVAALLFAATFLFGSHVQILRALGSGRRTTISFCAGMASAYVFVHVMPELEGARQVIVESQSSLPRFEGMAIYFLALVGFLVFYGLDHLRGQLQEDAGESGAEAAEAAAFRLHVGGFAAYVFLMAYLLVHNLEETETSLAVFTAAIVFHFLAVDHDLEQEHGSAYMNVGRWVMAGASLLGWAFGQIVTLPLNALALLVAFLSGAIIMNSLISELPSEKNGRYLPFMTGGLLYGLLLLPLS